MNDLHRLRARIDDLDRKLVELLAVRFDLARQVGQTKAESGLSVYDPERERRVLERVAELSAGRFPPERLRSIFREIISASRALESGDAVLVHGGWGGLAHHAALLRFGASARIATADRGEDLFVRLAEGSCSYAVVTLEGHSMEPSLDRLDPFLHSDVQVFGEIYAPATLGLYTHEAPAERIGSGPVFGTPTALAQASRWIGNQTGREFRLATSVADAVRMATEQQGSVLGHPVLEGLFGLRASVVDIEDLPGLTRRFLVLARRQAPATGRDKTTLLLVLPNRPGALHAVTEVLQARALNLSWLEPKATLLGPWDHIFVLEIEGHREDPPVRDALVDLKSRVELLRILGSYPSERRPERPA